VLGTGKVCVAKVACSSGEVTASSVGLAGCFTLLDFPYPIIVKDSDWKWYAPWRVHTETGHKRIRGGVGIRWANPSPSLMGDSCDVGPYQATRSARDAATGGFRVTVAAGSPALVLRAQGQAASPRLQLIAPNGARYTSPQAPAVIVPGREVFAEDSLNLTTDVTIARPVAGTWIVRALAGSAITSIRRAHVDTPPTVVAGVSPGRFKLTLGYSYQPDPLHVTRFVEDGANYEQELGPARGAPCQASAGDASHPMCGQIDFTPAPGPGGERKIYAITTMNGEITDKQLVAVYDAAREPEPSEVPDLIVQRADGGVDISWGASHAPEAAAMPRVYDVDINVSDGRKLLDVMVRSDHHVTVPDVAPDLRVTVHVAAVREDDTEGAMRTVTLEPGDAGAT
jgi:hypothetical protein